MGISKTEVLSVFGFLIFVGVALGLIEGFKLYLNSDFVIWIVLSLLSGGGTILGLGFRYRISELFEKPTKNRPEVIKELVSASQELVNLWVLDYRDKISSRMLPRTREPEIKKIANRLSGLHSKLLGEGISLTPQLDMEIQGIISKTNKLSGEIGQAFSFLITPADDKVESILKIGDTIVETINKKIIPQLETDFPA